MYHIPGKKRKLSLPNGEQHEALYVIVDLDDIKASHNEETFANTPGYPLNQYGQNLNDRNYKDDLAAQNNVKKIAENLNPESLISLSSTAAGTPIINKDGIVVSGNNRVMSLKLAVKDYPANYEKYKEQLAADADFFGVYLPGIIAHPVLVRIDQSLPEKLTTEDVAKFNQDSKKGERPVDQAIKLSNILLSNERCRNIILSIIDGYDTFSDLYAPQGRPDRKKIVDTLVQCGLIPQAQLVTYFDGNEFTDAGKNYLETLLSAIILTPDALKISSAEGVKRLRQIILTSLPVLIANENLPEGSLKKNVSDALIFQYKINQLGDFSDYMRSQSLFEEDKFEENTLYVNLLLNKGRNEFKESIKKYNEAVKSNSGASLFGEKMSIEEIFDKTIKVKAAETDKKMIDNFYKATPVLKPISTMQTDISTADAIIIEEPIRETVADAKLFNSGNWFKAHPDKVLGEAYEASGRFGPVTKYKGTIDALDRIDVPMDFIGAERVLNNPLLSTADDINVSAEVIKLENQDFLVSVIEKADTQVNEKLTEKRKKAIIEGDAVVMPAVPLQTFEDVYRTYNPGITKEETEVFIWYKTQQGQPLSRRWINLIARTYENDLNEPQAYNVPVEKLNEWIKKGLVYYYEGKLIPAPDYLSGNMYDKKLQLDRDKQEIIRLYGEEVHTKQATDFDKAWRVVYDKRLTITAGDDSLIVLPISKVANEFMISRIVEMPEDVKFRVKLVTAQSDKNYGKPDWAKDQDLGYYSEPYGKREEKDELSLTDAFAYWMLRYRPELKEAILHLDIIRHYCQGVPVKLNAKSDDKKDIEEAKARQEKTKASVQLEGQRLFAIFLDKQLEPNDKVRLETQWNADYNNYKPFDYNRIPVAFNMCRYYKGCFEKLQAEKREAVAFIMSSGSGILSYDVGVGKSPSAIFTISAFIDCGYAKRPVLCVPNQVYKQFISEIKNFTPHIPVIEGYNLSEEYLENFRGADGKIAMVPEGAITVITYEGLEQVGFGENTRNELLDGLYEILNQGGEAEREKSKKQVASFRERLEALLGRGMKGTIYNIEDFGWDFMCYDEAHKMKKVFTAVKGEETEDSKGNKQRGKNPYVINSGVPSSIGLKGFMLNYFIQRNKGSVLMLTATPFTNSPLEIFSMLAMVAYKSLQETDLNNIKSFFDTYVKTSTELVINTRLKPQFKQVILGFNNLISLQTLIRRFINYKTGEDVNVQRPNKYVLPYLTKVDNGIVSRLDEEERVETYIPMTPLQSRFMEQIIAYVEGGGGPLEDGEDETVEIDEDSGEVQDTTAIELSEDYLNDNEKLGVRTIKGLSYARNLALSPHLYVKSGLGKPDYLSYVNMSPKLTYVMRCIESVKKYHESKNEPVSGQVIYMDRGVEFFPLLKEYLVKVIGYADHEVGIIQSGLPKNGKKSKEYVKNLFNGEIYNEDTKVFEPVSDTQRIKVVIGSSTIKEGINLQRFGTVLYNCFIDWNPTDIQQLEGRVWRQGNTFMSVRIVNPLVIDSADIFLFQKLQEKTSRLNTIWATDGKKNVLNTEEFNPQELKYALIRDPKVIAELKSIEQKSTLQGDILGLNRQKEIISRIKKQVNEINSNFKEALQVAQEYRNVELTSDKLADAQALVKAINDVLKSQKDKEGKLMVRPFQRNAVKQTYETWTEFEERRKRFPAYSLKDEFYKPYWFSDFSIAVRDLNRQVNQFIKPFEIPFSLDYSVGLDEFLKQVDEKVKAAEAEIERLGSKDYIRSIENEIIRERAENKLEYKPLPQIIAEFGRLNYLLSDKKVKAGKAKFTTCPPLDDKGERDVSPLALAHMDNCLQNEGQTKDAYFDKEANAYNSVRMALHKKIIDELFKEVKCVSKGQPIAVFTGGSPASGKTTWLKKVAPFLLSPDVFHLDADEIRAKLPEYKGWNANSTHKETQDIVNDILSHIGEGRCRYDFVYDGTMNKASKYFSLINRVKALGYKTFIIFLDIPYGVARERALQRYKKSGRYVPMEVIDDFFKTLPNGQTMGQAALDELKPLVDGYINIDGLTGDFISYGGESLPDTRLYSKNVESVEAIAEVIEEPMKKATDIVHLPAAKRFNVGDTVKYVQGDLDKETWYGVITKKNGNVYRLDAFNVDYKKPSLSKVNEKDGVQLTDVSREVYDERHKEWKKKQMPAIEEKPVAEPTEQDIRDAIAGLEILADMGDTDAKDALEGLKLLI